MYCCYPPIVLKVSLHSTDVIPPQYWCYPPTVLMLSPRMYWCYPPTVLNHLHSTEAIPPQYWSYPPLYWSYPPTVLMLSPDVLNNLQCTEQPPQYWTDVIWGENLTQWYLVLQRPRISSKCSWKVNLEFIEASQFWLCPSLAGGGGSYLRSDFLEGRVTKILNFPVKIKGGGTEGGTCEVLRPCHSPKIWNMHLKLKNKTGELKWIIHRIAKWWRFFQLLKNEL